VLHGPNGIGVDSSGAVYITDYGNNSVLKLPSGAKEPITLPLPGLKKISGIAVGVAGDVYVADRGNRQVLRLSAD
jgi:serine/threonine-protein kinase